MFFKPARRIYDWAAQKATSTMAPLWLGLVFLLELVLFIPFDGLLMLFCMENPQRRYLYALTASVASVITGLIGYGIGYLLWDTVGPFVTSHLISQQFFDKLINHYTNYQHWAVFFGSLLPVPFKAISLSAGFCQLTLSSYLLFVFLARSLRFFFIAEMMNRWGGKIKPFVDRHFNRILMAVGAKVAIAFTFFWVISK
ncbi:MAG: YqaA family protein [Chlamydiales bacterium]